MSLRRKICMRIILLTLLLIAAICTVAAVLAVQQERQNVLDSLKMRVRVRAGEAGQFILHEDRGNLGAMLLRLDECHAAVSVAFIQKNGQLFLCSSTKDAPQTLRGCLDAGSKKVLVRDFRNEDGIAFLDIHSLIGANKNVSQAGQGSNPDQYSLHLLVRQDALALEADPLLIAITALGLVAAMLITPFAVDISRRTTREVDQVTAELREYGTKLEELVEKRTSTLSKYKCIVSTTSDHMSFVDRDYIYQAVSDTYLTAHKQKRDAIVGHTVAELIGDTAFKRHVKAKLDRCLSGETINYQAWLEFTGSDPRYMDVAYHPYFEADNSISGIVVSSRDITELHLAQEALNDQTMLLDNILRSASHMAIATTDLDFRITYYNPMSEILFGYTAAEVVGKTVMEIHTWEKVGPERFERAIEIVRNEGLYCYSLTQETESGPRYLDSRVTGIFDSAGEMVGYSLFSRDVTEHRRAEEAIKRRERYLTGLNDAAQVLLTPADAVPFQDFIDRIGPASDASRAYVFINHRRPDGELQMSQKAECCAENIKPEIDNPLMQSLSYNEWFPGWKDSLLRGDIINGRVADFSAKEREIFEPQNIQAILLIPIMVDKEVAGFIGFDNCISDRKWDEVEQTFLRAAASNLAQAIKRTRSEQQVLSSLEEKEVLLREIHHRVKNNMQVVTSLLNLQANRTTDQQVLEAIQESQSRIRAMSLIHEELYQSSDLNLISMQEYFTQLAGDVSALRNGDDDRITCIVEAGGTTLSINTAIPVGLIANELLTNAFKHAFSDGRRGMIRIVLRELDRNGLELIVADDGVGLSDEINMQDLNTLGLQLVSSLAESQLQGAFEVKYGNGTSFHIRFPQSRTNKESS